MNPIQQDMCSHSHRHVQKLRPLQAAADSHLPTNTLSGSEPQSEMVSSN